MGCVSFPAAAAAGGDDAAASRPAGKSGSVPSQEACLTPFRSSCGLSALWEAVNKALLHQTAWTRARG